MDTRADEHAAPTPVAEHGPLAESTAEVPSDIPPLGTPATQDTAVAIARQVAAVKGDARAELVSVTPMTLKQAITELSPGMELFGYDSDEPVFVVRFKGGPFDHVRSIPINRDRADFMTNGLFVVVAASDGDVIGTGGLRY